MLRVKYNIIIYMLFDPIVYQAKYLEWQKSYGKRKNVHMNTQSLTLMLVAKPL